MRFIHTADWHLGRLFHGVHLTEDQAHVLEQLCDLVRDEKPDAVIVAGDVYDRAVPPPDAVELLDDTLSRLVLDLGVPTLLIAGNHDSASRLGFGSRVLAEKNLFTVTSSSPSVTMVTLRDSHGPVHFFPVPYIEPAVVRSELGEESAVDQESAMVHVVGRARAAIPHGERSVLIAHGFVLGGERSDSERPLSAGGVEGIDASCFHGFGYVALGHLHRPQRAGVDHIRYSGSLLKYSFSEVNHRKVVNLVEMDTRGDCKVEEIVLTPRRDVRRIEGLLHDLINRPEDYGDTEDYLVVSVQDKGAILDVMGKLREVYPNVLHVERPGQALARDRQGRRRPDHRKLDDWDLFRDFFEEVTGEVPSSEHRSAYESIVGRLRLTDAEAER